MILQKLFKKNKFEDEDILTKEELIINLRNQINCLYEYSTDTLEKILNLENELKNLEKSRIKIEAQAAIAHKKSNHKLYNRAISKLEINDETYSQTIETINSLKEKLAIAVKDIKILEISLDNLS